MEINITSYNKYSFDNEYLGGNSAGRSIISPQSSGDTGQAHAGAGSKEPLGPRSDPHATTATDPTGTETSNSQPEQKQRTSDSQLTQAELQLLTELKQVDTEVRNHEMAHVAAGGGLITSGASFTYKKGPDGQNYAVAGEVSIDTSTIPGDPQATLQKMKQVKRAALAPSSPSSQDLKVASNATAMAVKAGSELIMLMAKEQATKNETQVFGGMKQASDSYIKVNNLPEDDNSTFKLAV